MLLKNKHFLMYYLWPNTMNNHCGMGYLAEELGQLSKENAIPVNLSFDIKRIFFIPRRIFRKYCEYLIYKKIKKKLKKDNVILFMEYLGTDEMFFQVKLAKKLRKKGFKNKFLCILHLPYKKYLNYFNENEINEFLKYIDKIIVFGSSLKKDLISNGIDKDIIVTKHYAELKYYKPNNKRNYYEKLRVISFGNLFRNDELLKDVIYKCPESINFILIKHNIGNYYSLKSKNVIVYEYIPENELLSEMQKSHISLSILEDTIGSNTITTSMATGLVNVVSDVGSIRDYCNNNNSILCKNHVNEFVNALKYLNDNREKLKELSKNALMKSKEFDILNFINLLNEI